MELVRDYEHQLRTAESRTYWAMTAMILRRLTGAAAPMPDRPAYQQILAVFATADAPPRARQVCEAMDLTVAPNKINNTRLKLKQLVERGILTETVHRQPVRVPRRKAGCRRPLCAAAGSEEYGQVRDDGQADRQYREEQTDGACGAHP
ncbi:hypothetical protein ACIOHE_38955 [Streptomyces sp. NPDC087851]|uniref:hypothetical protein n=1 Tax=Streptomyces sp. NPDC087851 TaxID=3365810 RepID=UPI00381FBF32